MAIKLPLFQGTAELVDDKGRPTFLFHRWWQEVVETLQTFLGELEDLVLDLAAVNQAALDAKAAAEAAQAAADAAQDSAGGAGEVAKLSSSGVDGLVLSATDAGTDVTVTISDHTRVYADDSQVTVTGGTLTGLTYSTAYYFYYNDPEFDGGTVTYVATTVKTEAAQTGTRHLVGQVFTPGAAEPPKEGETPPLPGFGGFGPNEP